MYVGSSHDFEGYRERMFTERSTEMPSTRKRVRAVTGPGRRNGHILRAQVQGWVIAFVAARGTTKRSGVGIKGLRFSFGQRVCRTRND